MSQKSNSTASSDAQDGISEAAVSDMETSDAVENHAKAIGNETDIPGDSELGDANLGDVQDASGDDAESSAIRALEQEVAQLRLAAQTEKDRALRAAAELDNFRKRKEQEVESFKKYAYEKVVTEFLVVLDGFTLAKTQQKPDADLQSMIDGYQSIEKQFLSVLSKLGVTPIDALNQPFDPTKHQAVMQESVDGVAPDIVVKELQKGFQLHDRVIRPSMVAVSQ